MPPKSIKISILRYDPSIDHEPYYQNFEVPKVEGMSILDVLDYVYEHIDGSLAYYDHAACQHGICGLCTVFVDSKPVLMCQTLVLDDMVIEPMPKSKVIRDLVYLRNGED